MKVTMLLADAAQAVGGKLYILGGGWSMVEPQPTPMALAIKIELPWDRANMKHKFRLELLDIDERPVRVPVDQSNELEPLVIEGEFELGRPPGLKPGTALDIPLAFNLPPIALEPGRQYQWRLSFEKYDHEDWRVVFATRSQLPT